MVTFKSVGEIQNAIRAQITSKPEQKVVKPWIERVLDYIKPVACIGELD